MDDTTNMPETRLNCWEFMRCGREPGGAHASELGICPAPLDTSADGYNGGRNGGRTCWTVAGTLCGVFIRGTQAKTTPSCLSCAFLLDVKVQEGDRLGQITHFD